MLCVAVIGPELSDAMSGVHGLISCDILSHGCYCFVWLLLVQSMVQHSFTWMIHVAAIGAMAGVHALTGCDTVQ